MNQLSVGWRPRIFADHRADGWRRPGAGCTRSTSPSRSTTAGVRQLAEHCNQPEFGPARCAGRIQRRRTTAVPEGLLDCSPVPGADVTVDVPGTPRSPFWFSAGVHVPTATTAPTPRWSVSAPVTEPRSGTNPRPVRSQRGAPPTPRETRPGSRCRPKARGRWPAWRSRRSSGPVPGEGRHGWHAGRDSTRTVDCSGRTSTPGEHAVSQCRQWPAHQGTV